MILIALWDGAIYGPTRFIVGCPDKAQELMDFFDSGGYAYDSFPISPQKGEAISSCRSEEEMVRIQKWMEKHFAKNNMGEF